MKSYFVLLAALSVILLLIGYKGTTNILTHIKEVNKPECKKVHAKRKHQEKCWTDAFKRFVLVITFNYPFYDSIPLLKEFYEPVFPTIFFCGPKSNTSVSNVTMIEINRGIFGYECMGQAIRRYHGYEGYFFINDDVILNYWNLVGDEFTTERIWKSNNQFGHVDLNGDVPNNWYWWVSPYGFRNAKAAVDEIRTLSRSFKAYEDLHNIYIKNGKNTSYLYNGRSDVFFIPGKFALKFQEVSRIFYQHRVFLEIAVPTILSFLTDSVNVGTLKGYYIPGDVRKNDPRVVDSRYFWTLYLNQPNLWFIHPFKLHHNRDKNKDLNLVLMKHLLIGKTKLLTNC